MSTDEHDWFDGHAAAYVMGGLPADERTRIEAHAAECAPCAAKLAELLQTDQTMNHLFASMRPSAGFEQAIIDRLDWPMRLVGGKANPIVRRAAVAAAAAIVLAGFGYVANEKINNDRWPPVAWFRGESRGEALVSAQRSANASSEERFIAPESKAQKWDYGGGTNSAQNWANWANGSLLKAESYSYENPYDHGKAGQNMLSVNGHVELTNNPFVGVQRDNAYTTSLGKAAGPAVVQGPGDGNDSILLPTDGDNKLELKSSNSYGGVLQLGLKDRLAHTPTALVTPPHYFQPEQPTYYAGVRIVDNGGITSPQAEYHSLNRLETTAEPEVGQLQVGLQLHAIAGDRDARAVEEKKELAREQFALATNGAVASSSPDTAAKGKAIPEAAPAAGEPVAPVPPISPQPVQRKVIRNGTMDFVVESFDSAYLQVAAIVAEEGGYVATTNSQQMPNGKVTGTVTVRVAPDHLDVLVLKLRALGELKGQRITAEDVTQQYTDLASELRAARAMEERLLELIKDGKGSIKDLLAAEKELGDWREKIEKITGQMNYFDSLVSLSTLELTLTEKDIKTPALASQTETVDMGVETEDVEKARDEAINAIDEVKGRIVESELKQFDAGQLAGKIVADVPPDKAGPVIDHLKQLGTVSRLEVQRQEVTTDGHGNNVNADTLPPGLRVEQKDTRLTLSLYNLANVAPRETANVELACDDVEASYHAILDRVGKAGGRVISSNLSRPTPDQVTGSLSFEVKSADADGVLMDVKQAGEVMQSNVTENPDTNNVTGSKRGFSVQLRSLASVNPREVRTLSVAAPDVTVAYNKLLAMVQGLKARVVLSKLDNEQDANGNVQNETAGWLDFEVKRGDVDAVEQAIAAAGDAIQRQVVRSNDDQNTLDTKLQFKVGLHNAALLPPRESWTLSVECGNVEAAQADVLSSATAAGARVVDSTLSKEADGKTTANITIDVPLDQSAVVVDRVKQEGDLRVVQSTRNEQAPDGKLARSRLAITIASPESIVTADHGLWGTIRSGLSTSVAGLLWSLQLIVIGACLVGPWVAAIWVGWRVMKRRGAKAS